LSATFTDSADIGGRIEDFDLRFDVDADGKTEPLTDGLLIIRRLFGFSGEALISEAVPEEATRTSAEEIEEYIDGISQ
jgi:hypothetical protein